MASMVVVSNVSSDSALDDVRQLFAEYAQSIGFSLAFQGFDQELSELPGRYAPPSGRLLVARIDDVIAGCVALRMLDHDVCEMKRLFVRPAFQGKGVGRRLVDAIIDAARAAGYRTMRLDTVPAMRSAIALYQTVGFYDVAPYTENPIEGARFLELRLQSENPDSSSD